MYVRGLIGKLAITNYLSPTTVPTIFVPTVSRLTNPIAHVYMQGVDRRGYDLKYKSCLVEWWYNKPSLSSQRHNHMNNALRKILVRTIERLGVDVGSLLLKKLPLFIGDKK